ncbi:hypothetical protein JCM19233_151 [Vibrio astriarenae]|nr:hypothetical protein JCM19233_151 [Vibrio sp. C7]
MVNEMSRYLSDKHSHTERGWTPPPKGYTDQFDDATDDQK